MASERWYRAELPYYVAAFSVRDDGSIWTVAPVMRRWHGVTFSFFERWVEAQGGTIAPLAPIPTQEALW